MGSNGHVQKCFLMALHHRVWAIFLIAGFTVFLLFNLAEMLFLIHHGGFYFNETRLSQDNIHGSRLFSWDYTEQEQPPNYSFQLLNNSFDNDLFDSSSPGWMLAGDSKAMAVTGNGDTRGIEILKGAMSQKVINADKSNDYGPLIASAWIKSDVEKNAYIGLEIDGQSDLQRQYHPGDGIWRMVSVVHGGHNEKLNVNVVLGIERHKAAFDNVRLVLGRLRKEASLEIESTVMRFRELVNKEKTGRYRILTLGGSTTYGHTEFYETWPYILEQKLNSYYPGQFEVINLGLPDFSTVDILRNSMGVEGYDNGYLDLQPDMVILSPVWNDLFDAFSSRDNFEAINRKFRSNIFVKKTALGYFIYKYVYSRRIELLFNRLREYYQSDDTLDERSEEDVRQWLKFMSTGPNKKIPGLAFQYRLEDIVDLFQSKGVAVLLMSRPCIWLTNFNADESRKIMIEHDIEEAETPPGMIKAWLIVEELDRKIIQDVARETGAHFDDFTSYFRMKFPHFEDRVEYFQDGTHFNPAGNMLLADYIYNSETFNNVIHYRFSN